MLLVANVLVTNRCGTLFCHKTNVEQTMQNAAVIPLWKIALSIVLMIVAIFFCTVISASVY